MTKYLRYEIVNVEPLRISDASNSKNGQTSIIRYISGSAIRGFVINKMAERNDFESIKKDLFSNKIRYLNAYICAKSPDGKLRELMPSPKGLYEDKSEVKDIKKIDNVLVGGQFEEGYKRASLGRYCYIENTDMGKCVYYTGVETGSDMKINIQNREEQKVFRSEYISEGYTFVGYIAFDIDEASDKNMAIEDLASDIKEVFNNVILIGNARSQGLGKCKVIACEFLDDKDSESIPYQSYLPKCDIIQKEANANNEVDKKNVCYMMLLSNTAMKNSYGEACGLDLKKLQSMMQVKDLEIEYSSTSVVEVKGYNRTWGMVTPSVMMYEMGSVFKLRFNGNLTRENICRICNKGIGVKRNEGFGRVLFIDEYDQVNCKKAIAGNYTVRNSNNVNFKADITDEDKEVLTKIAKTYYRNIINGAMIDFVMNNNKMNCLKKTNNSKKGSIEAFSIKYRYTPNVGVEKIKEYLGHMNKKMENQKVQKEKADISSLDEFIGYILDDKNGIEDILGIETKDALTVMGISKDILLSKDEIKGLKLELITMAIRYDNKEVR